METVWAISAFPQPCTILRLKLRPYCCGHEINLCQIESPFVLGGESDAQDLLTAVLICSQDFEGGQRLIRDGYSSWFSRIWKLLLARRSLAAFEEMLRTEQSRFRGYLTAGNWSPEINRPISGVETRKLKAPRVYRLIQFLTSRFNLGETEALNFPMARANAYYAAHLDAENRIDLTGGEDDILASHLADLEARAAKGENVWD